MEMHSFVYIPRYSFIVKKNISIFSLSDDRNKSFRKKMCNKGNSSVGT
jgi:hypothetical protein